MGRTCQMSATADSSDKQRTGLARMQLAQLLGRNILALELNIKALAAHHTEITGTHSHLTHSFDECCWLHILLLQHHLKGQGQQAITGQHSHSLAIHLVIS